MTPDSTHETRAYEVKFPLSWLAAIRLFSAKDDPRDYLNGVAVSRGGIVATNGHILGVMRDARFSELPELIIPNYAIDDFVRGTAGLVKTYKHFLDSRVKCNDLRNF